MGKLHRRALLQRGAQLLSAFTVLPLVAQAAETELACVEPASASLRASLNYTDPAAKAEESCGTCGFFTADGKSACGACAIMSDPVSAHAHCESWGAKSS